VTRQSTVDRQTAARTKKNSFIGNAAANQKTKQVTVNNRFNTNPKNYLSDRDNTSITLKNQATRSEVQEKTALNLTSKSPLEEKNTVLNSTVLPEGNSHSTLSSISKLTGHGWQWLKITWPAPTVAYTPPPAPPVVPKKQDVSTFFRKGLSARAVAGPDLSYIATGDMMKNPSLLLSIMLEYRFSKRWSLQTGAMRSAKLYNATAEQYQWPDEWYSQKARPTSIWGNCKVLDIPLNVRFDLSQGVKSRLFVSSGISSYRMLKEKYDYTYPPHTYGIKWPSWEGSTGNYWFGVMNMSVGFERQIGRNWSLQAEPYFKLPLAEVGMGKIKLNTSGIFISARYRLGRF
jgi:hypothetical protein